MSNEKKDAGIDKFLETTLENNRYYNFAILPFNYGDFVKKSEVLNQVKAVSLANEFDEEMAKSKLQKIIYTELYKRNFTVDEVQDYFQKAVLTDKFKNYLGMAFKFAIQYNRNEDPYISTFIHLAQLFMADLCYEYVWRLEHRKA